MMMLLLCLVGCQPKGQTSPPALDLAAASPYWMSVATSLRVYPTTRFVRQGEDAVLEARVELFDEMGDSIKGTGGFRIELKDAVRSKEDGLLYTWQVELHTLADQQRYYDPVTRGYLFRLKIDDIAIAKQPVTLVVTFTRYDGQRFSAEAKIKTDW